MPYMPTPVPFGEDPSELRGFLDRELHDISMQINLIEGSITPIYGGLGNQAETAPIACGPAGIRIPFAYELPGNLVTGEVATDDVLIKVTRNYVYTFELSMTSVSAAQFKIYAKVDGVQFGDGMRWDVTNQTYWTSHVFTDLVRLGAGTRLEMWLESAGNETVTFGRMRLFVTALNGQL